MKTFDIHVDMGTNSYDRKLNGEENIFKLKDVFIAYFFSSSQDWFYMQEMIKNCNIEILVNNNTLHLVKTNAI